MERVVLVCTTTIPTIEEPNKHMQGTPKKAAAAAGEREPARA
jgi:hypothetical protein